MADIRNASDKARDYQLAYRGLLMECRTDGDFTWYKFGSKNSGLGPIQFRKKFNRDWNKIRDTNLDEYGCECPWAKTAKGRAILTDQAQKFSKLLVG